MGKDQHREKAEDDGRYSGQQLDHWLEVLLDGGMRHLGQIDRASDADGDGDH